MRTYICPGSHKHGQTPTCYRSHKCGCDACRLANNARCYRHKQLVAYGRPTGTLVPASPVQEHLRVLFDAGVTPAAAAKAAGVDLSTIRNIVRGGTARQHRYPQLLVYAATAQKILAVSTDLTTLPDGAWVQARGVQRRVQALCARGWSITLQASLAGVSRERIDLALRGGRVKISLYRAVADLYDRLWDQEPPTRSRYDRSRRTMALRRAAHEGWVPPLAWDDIDSDGHPADCTTVQPVIDTVAVDLALHGESVHLTALERAAVIELGRMRGMSERALGKATGVTPRHVVRIHAAMRKEAA